MVLRNYVNLPFRNLKLLLLSSWYHGKLTILNGKQKAWKIHEESLFQ